MTSQPLSLQAIRGMPDILPAETELWQQVEGEWSALMQAYGYGEIRTPLLEKTGLFKRSIGEVTDIVEKEMFTFSDRDGESITLRPEGTASCVRAGLEHGLLYNQIQRLWYVGSMFRYEKPQKGRYRQFNQFGVEAFGLEGPDIDVEQIMMINRFFKRLAAKGILPREEYLLQKKEVGSQDNFWIRLQINSLGSVASRERYRGQLVEYFKRYVNDLDEDSQRRLQTNPLRILDSKNPQLKEIIAAAPKSIDYLVDADKQHYEQLQALLVNLGIAFEINPCLVRGLDYYNRTVYEWVTDKLGAQGTICAGGRYDGLVEQLGGKATPAVGFAMGIERLILLIQTWKNTQNQAGTLFPHPSPDIYFICLGEAAQTKALQFSEQLRDQFPKLKLVVNCGGGNFKNQFKRADKAGAKMAFILAEQELLEGKLSIKSLRREGLLVPSSLKTEDGENEQQISLPLQVEQVAHFLASTLNK